MRDPSFLLLGALAVLAGACGGASSTVRAEPRSGTPSRAAAKDAPSDPGAAPFVAPPEVSAHVCARRRPGTGPARLGAVRQGSAVALARAEQSTIAYVADEDDSAIHTVDIDRQRELAVTPLAGAPSALLVLADGRVAVILRDQSRVAIYEPRERADLPLEERCEAPVAADPVGLAITPDDGRLLVTSGWGRKLTALDPGDLHPVFAVDLPREPRSVLASDDGRVAFVAHVVGGLLSAVSLPESAPHAVHSIDLRVGSHATSRGQSEPRAGCQGYALASAVVAGGAGADKAAGPVRLFAPLVSIDPGEAKLTSGYGSSDGWGPAVEEPLVSVVDAAGERALTRTLGFSRVRHGKECLLPRAAVVSGERLLVSCLGIDALLELDARALDPIHVERRRFRVPAGPVGVAVDSDRGRAVVWSQFAREIALVDLTPPLDPRSGALSSGKPGAAPPSLEAAVRIPVARREGSWITPAVARGRELFHSTVDLRISKDGRACASCHPDGREDALTWSTPDGPRQTIMLAGRVTESAPYGWVGASPTLKAHISHTFQRLGGRGLVLTKDQADFDALLAYLGAMRAPTRAGANVDPARRERVLRGKELFASEQQGCITCHLDGGTDRAAHDVQSGHMEETSLKFDTPSLRFVSGTAPYFHDGRYRTLEELLEASDGKMGHTHRLSRDDLLALTAYLETL
jgi:cytochrome c peroxidase